MTHRCDTQAISSLFNILSVLKNSETLILFLKKRKSLFILYINIVVKTKCIHVYKYTLLKNNKKFNFLLINTVIRRSLVHTPILYSFIGIIV
jgi:hypothetical protein